MVHFENASLINEATAVYRDYKQTKRSILVDAKKILSQKQFTNFKTVLDSSAAAGADRDLKAALNYLAESAPESLPHNYLLHVFETNINSFFELRDHINELYESNRATLDAVLAANAKAIRLALTLFAENNKINSGSLVKEAIYKNAGSSKRFLTAAETARVGKVGAASGGASAVSSLTGLAQSDLQDISDRRMRDILLETLAKLKLREAHRELAAGLLETPQMKTIIAEALPSLTRGEPMLLIGETGGAKTALAEYLSSKISSNGHEFISGYGDISSTQVIGAHELRSEGGATVSAFVPGPMIRAMIEGKAIILDEINAMPPEFLKRLNRILQLQQGDEYQVQENAGQAVRVAPGFVIIATANEQSSDRYRGTYSLSSELVNRFGASTFRVHYPDANNGFEDDPQENLLLASIALSDARGDFPGNISLEDVTKVARFAFITQQIFSGRYGDGFDDFVSNDNRIDGRPGLEESVLAPRTLVKLLQNVRDSAGAITIEHALKRFIDGVMHPEDRAVLLQIMHSQGFAE